MDRTKQENAKQKNIEHKTRRNYRQNKGKKEGDAKDGREEEAMIGEERKTIIRTHESWK